MSLLDTLHLFLALSSQLRLDLHEEFLGRNVRLDTRRLTVHCCRNLLQVFAHDGHGGTFDEIRLLRWRKRRSFLRLGLLVRNRLVEDNCELFGLHESCRLVLLGRLAICSLRLSYESLLLGLVCAKVRHVHFIFVVRCGVHHETELLHHVCSTDGKIAATGGSDVLGRSMPVSEHLRRYAIRGCQQAILDPKGGSAPTNGRFADLLCLIIVVAHLIG